MFEDGIGGEKDARFAIRWASAGYSRPAAFNRISFMLIASKEKSFEKACEENNFYD